MQGAGGVRWERGPAAVGRGCSWCAPRAAKGGRSGYIRCLAGGRGAAMPRADAEALVQAVGTRL